MSTQALPRRAPHLAAMFQKAYAQAVTLQSADEQIEALIDQREALEAEIRDIQAEINLEFERVLAAARQSRLRLRAQLNDNPNPPAPVPHMKIMPVVRRAVAAS